MRVFSRYGVKRTTMNDIASEAGIVRQTLYNVYANKDDVLRATICRYSANTLAAIEAECAATPTLDGKLDALLNHLAIKPFELLSASPHADEILAGFNDAAKQELSTADESYRIAIESVLAPHAKAIKAAGLTVPQLSDFVQNSLAALKHKAKNKKHLRQLLSALKAVVLALAEPR